jgi:hypothetical protein
VLVNPELLKGFASQVDDASAALKGLNADALTSADGLAGSSTQWVMRQVGDHFGLAADQIAGNVGAIGGAVRGAGDAYAVEDDSLADSFTRIF